MEDFLRGLYEHGVFSRGLPTRGDLKADYAKSLLQVLKEPGRFVVAPPHDQQPRDPLRQCLERGWLFSEHHTEEEIKYRFASQLHEIFAAWLLLEGEDSINARDLRTFRPRSPQTFQPKESETKGRSQKQ